MKIQIIFVCLIEADMYLYYVFPLHFQECSIFVFEKRTAEKLHKPKRKDLVTEILRASVKQLERFRHPKVRRIIFSILN